MTYSQYTIIPSDNVVVLDGTAAFGVDMAGIPAGVHAVQWYGVRGYGLIEPQPDPLTGVLGPSTQFQDYSRFLDLITQAEAIIYAQENPQVFYSTSNSNVYEGLTYLLGQQVLVDTPNGSQPPETTSLVPPTPEDFQQLYWYGDAWVVSGVDPSLGLPEAQTLLTNAVLTSVADNVNSQARIYSSLQLASEAAPGLLPCADLSGVTLDDYQTSQNADGQVVITQVNSAASVAELYSVDPNISPSV